MTHMDLAYRKTAMLGASGLDLQIALFDTLAGDLRRAAEAERNNDLEARARELNHAFVVIAFLEDRLAHGTGGELADKLRIYYSNLRRNLMLAQGKRSAEGFEQEMDGILSIRASWQQVLLRDCSSESHCLQSAGASRFPAAETITAESMQAGWLA